MMDLLDVLSSCFDSLGRAIIDNPRSSFRVGNVFKRLTGKQFGKIKYLQM